MKLIDKIVSLQTDIYQYYYKYNFIYISLIFYSFLYNILAKIITIINLLGSLSKTIFIEILTFKQFVFVYIINLRYKCKTNLKKLFF